MGIPEMGIIYPQYYLCFQLKSKLMSYLTLLVAVLISLGQAVSAQTQQAPYKEEQIRWVDNEVLVRFGDSYNIQPKENAFTNTNIREALSDQAIRKIEQLFP